jgi:predicted XRE-type DNA-binding protein
MVRKTEIPVERGSGNVFADLELPDAPELNTKLILAKRLNDRLAELGWKQAEIARRLGIAQPNVSMLLNYKLDNFSSEKLMGFFTALGYDVEFLIRPARGKTRGEMRVLMAA